MPILVPPLIMVAYITVSRCGFPLWFPAVVSRCGLPLGSSAIHRCLQDLDLALLLPLILNEFKKSVLVVHRGLPDRDLALLLRVSPWPSGSRSCSSPLRSFAINLDKCVLVVHRGLPDLDLALLLRDSPWPSGPRSCSSPTRSF